MVEDKPCEYCYDGTFMGQILILGNDGKWHQMHYCPNCGNKLGYWIDAEVE